MAQILAALVMTTNHTHSFLLSFEDDDCVKPITSTPVVFYLFFLLAVNSLLLEVKSVFKHQQFANVRLKLNKHEY